MATFSDYLETVIAIKGAEAFTAQMNQMAASTGKLAKVEDEKSTALMRGGETLAWHAAQTLAAAVAVNEFIKATEAMEDATFRTTILLHNLGSSLSIGRVQAFADSLAQSTSASRSQLIGLVGLEKQFGIADNQVEALSKTLLDFAKGNAKGMNLEQVSNAALKAINGNPMLLKRMGIQFQDTGDKARNTIELMTRLNALFGGAAEAERNTLSGAFNHLAASWENFASSIRGLIPAINTLADLLDKLAGHPSLSTGLAGTAAGFGIGKFFGPEGAAIGAVLGGLAGALAGHFAGGGPNPAESVGKGKERLATEDTLQEIAKNTKAMSDAFIKEVLGGSGVVAKSAFTSRDARIAFGI